MQKENNMKINFEEELEHAYRRGYSHGFSVGSIHREPEKIDELMKKIGEWRSDLSNRNGAPGSDFNDITMYFPKS